MENLKEAPIPNGSGANHHIFIAGLHRSGTSLLAELLGNLSMVSGFRNTAVPHDEGQFLQTVFAPARDYGGPGRFGFSPEMHLTEHSPQYTAENRRKLIQEWQQYWELDKPYLLEKSPPNLLKLRFLQAVFPDSYFIVIMRHPVATAYATGKWSGTNFRQLIEHWLVCHDLYLADKPSLQRIYELKYERFVQEPTACFQEILQFLDIAPPPDLNATLSARVKDHNANYFSKWQNPHRNILKKLYFRVRYQDLEYRVNQYGYSLFDLQRY